MSRESRVTYVSAGVCRGLIRIETRPDHGEGEEEGAFSGEKFMPSRSAKPEEVDPTADARAPSSAAVRPPDPSSPPASLAPLTMKSLGGPAPTLLQRKQFAKEAPAEEERGEQRAAPPVRNGSHPEVAPNARATDRHRGGTVAKSQRRSLSAQNSHKDGGSGAGAMEGSAGGNNTGNRGSGEVIVGRQGADIRRSEGGGGVVEVEVDEGRTAGVVTAATANPIQRRIGDRKDEDKDPPKGVSSGDGPRDREGGLGVKGGDGRDAPPSSPSREDNPTAGSVESLPPKRDGTEALVFIGGEGGHGDTDADGDGDAGGGFERAADGDLMGPASGPAEGEKSQTVPGQDGGGGAGGEPSPGGSRSGAGGSSSPARIDNGRLPILKAEPVGSGEEVINGLAETGARVKADVVSSSEHSPKRTMSRDMRMARSTTDSERFQPPSLLRLTSKYMHEDLAEAKRKQSLRAHAKRHKKLSFADEHGDALYETEYHPDLYYSKGGVPPPRSARACCTIS